MRGTDKKPKQPSCLVPERYGTKDKDCINVYSRIGWKQDAIVFRSNKHECAYDEIFHTKNEYSFEVNRSKVAMFALFHNRNGMENRCAVK